jgi:hypothetical protein
MCSAQMAPTFNCRLQNPNQDFKKIALLFTIPFRISESFTADVISSIISTPQRTCVATLVDLARVKTPHPEPAR